MIQGPQKQLPDKTLSGEIDLVNKCFKLKKKNISKFFNEFMLIEKC